MKEQMKVFLGVSGALVGTFLLTTNFGAKKKGHGLFDVDKPEAVERKMREAETANQNTKN